MKSSIRIIAITIIAYAVHFIIDETFFRNLRQSIYNIIQHVGISHIITYTIVGIPLFIGVLLMHNRKDFFKSLGFNKSALKAFLFALLCVSSMLIGYGIAYDFNSEFTVNRLLISIISAGFFEELYFRGFLFGQLFRYTRLGFIPAVLLGAIIFALGHLYQSTEFGELIGIFVVTFLGSILFSWVYIEWRSNLWVPIFLHMLMNFSWEVFSVDDTAFGGLYPNIFRGITIFLVIVLTVIYKKKRKEKFEINKHTIWMKKIINEKKSYPFNSSTDSA